MPHKDATPGTPTAADPGGGPGPSLLPAWRPPDADEREALRLANSERKDMGRAAWIVLDVILTVAVFIVIGFLLFG